MIGIGIIGTGKQGADHAKRIASMGERARVVTVHDALQGRAHSIATEVGATVAADDEAVIEHPEVDAVIIAAPSETHPDFSVACISAGKPALCEKPLAVTVEGCVRVMDAEIEAGQRFIQVGFMRRFDERYRRVKDAIDDGSIGEPLVLHCIHRNASVPQNFRTTQTLTDSTIHEIDISRWLLGQEIVTVSVEKPRRSPHAPEQLSDPLLVHLETTGGVVVEVEAFINARYGYDVRCEVVGAEGYVSLEPMPHPLVTLASARSQALPEDWLTRFDQAYGAEIGAWLDALETGAPAPDAWDGYAATVVAEACVRALRSGQPEAVTLGPRPALYAAASDAGSGAG